MGSITDEEAREITVDLSFLDAGRKYVASIYSDAPDADWRTNPLAYDIRKEKVDTSTVLKMYLAPGGGQAVSIVPAAGSND